LNINANPSSKAVQNEIKEVLKKNPGKEIVVKIDTKAVENAAKFEMTPSDTINALDFATQNVDQYYPDMKEHLTTMMNSFRDEEHQSATIKLLDEMVVNITDPAQKTGAIIYALEGVFRENQSFSLKYDEEITDETFAYIEIFDAGYKTRFKGYYARLEEQTKRLQEEIIKKQELIKQKDEEIKQKDEEIKQKDEEIKKSLQELENTLSKFSPEDIKSNTSIKQLTIETEKFYRE
jgi:hypothetical protein